MTPVPHSLGRPGSYLTLEEGTPVVSSDRKEVARVEEVLADEGADVFEGLVIDTGALGLDRRYVEADLVDEVYERGVVLTIDAAAAEELPRPGDAAGTP